MAIRGIKFVCRSDIFNEDKRTLLIYKEMDNVLLFRNQNEALFMARGLDNDRLVMPYPVNSDSNSYLYAWESNKCALYDLDEEYLIPEGWNYKEVVVK